jgi:hypothetical protein
MSAQGRYWYVNTEWCSLVVLVHMAEKSLESSGVGHAIVQETLDIRRRVSL